MKGSTRRIILIYSAIYVLLALGFVGVCAIFGRSLVQAYDAFDQHYPNMLYISRYYKEIAANIMQGNWSLPAYDLNLGDGQSILYTLYFYGLADPFNLPLVAIPTQGVIYYYSFLLLLRPYLAGLAFLWLCRTKGYTGPAVLAGALTYILSGFGLYAMSVHPFFMNAMIGLPLMVIGFDRIRAHRSPLLFIATVFVMALQGFYFTYMVSLMVVLYAIVCVIRIPDSKHPVRDALLLFLRTTGYYLLGLMMAMFIFLPGIVGFLQSNRMTAANEYNIFTYSWDTLRYKFTNLIAIRFDDDVVAMPVMALVAILALCGSELRKNWRLFVLLILGALSYFLPAPALMLNGGNVYARHVFGLILVLSYTMVWAMAKAEAGELSYGRGQKLAYILICLTLVAQAVTYAGRTRWQTIGVLLWAMEAIILGILLHRRKLKRWGLTIFTVCCLFAQVALLALEFLPTMRQWNPYEEYVASAPAVAAAYQREKQTSAGSTDLAPDAPTNAGAANITPDAQTSAGAANLAPDAPTSGFARVDADDQDCYFYNVGAALDIPTTRTYTSLLSRAQTKLWWDLALTSGNNGYRIYGLDARTALETLAGVDTYATGTDGNYRVPYGFTYATTQQGKAIYENPYALSLGYVYTNQIDEERWEAADSVYKTDLMLQGVYLEQETLSSGATGQQDMSSHEAGTVKNHTSLRDAKIICGEGVSYENGVLSVSQAGASLRIEFAGVEDAETYLRLDGLYTHTPMRGQVITQAGEPLHMEWIAANDIYYFGRKEYLYNLGYSKDAQREVTIVFDNPGELTLEKIEIETLSMEDYVEDVTKLRTSLLQVDSVDQGVIRGELEAQEAGVLTLSIPYMNGYEILIDGQKTAYACANIWYVGVPIEKGHHAVMVTYHNPGSLLGVILSLAGLLGTILCLLLRCVQRRP